MYRGTTPTIRIHFEMDMSQFAALWVTFYVKNPDEYAETSEVTVTKQLGEGVETDGQNVTVSLSQQDTLLLGSLQPDRNQRAEVQVRGKTAGGNAYASNIMTVPVLRILKDGEI